MFELEKSFYFEAGHELKHHDGKCVNPHGHSYTAIVKLRGKELQTSGPKKNMLVDFHDVDKAMRPIIEEFLDHKWLNDTLKTDSPTAEFIAQFIFEKVKPNLSALYCITVFETKTASATFFEP